VKAWFMGLFMKKAGSAVPSANRITLLRDGDGDGVAELRTVFATTSTRRSAWRSSATTSTSRTPTASCATRTRPARPACRAAGQGRRPAGRSAQPPLDQEPDRVARRRALYRDGGLEQQRRRERHGGGRRARGDLGSRSEERQQAPVRVGLRNPNGMAWEPDSGALWTAVNERDELGTDSFPTYMTAVKDGGFYGWPYSYYGGNVDTRVEPQRPDLVAKAIKPDYALGSHTASLGLASARGAKLAAGFENGMFVGQHGSWNRKPPSGYKVIFVPFANGRPSGPRARRAHRIPVERRRRMGTVPSAS
jgi:glucose/arabinose dehydrogenase